MAAATTDARMDALTNASVAGVSLYAVAKPSCRIRRWDCHYFYWQSRKGSRRNLSALRLTYFTESSIVRKSTD